MKKRVIKVVTTNSRVNIPRHKRHIVPVNNRRVTYPRTQSQTTYQPIPVRKIDHSIEFSAVPGTAKIAFMFLTIESLHQGERWHQFLDQGRDRATVYCHPKYPNHIKQKFLQDSIISNRIATSWANVSLVRATNNMIAEALKDPDNQYFMLLSEKCMPLYDFDHTYEQIVETGKSWIFNYKWTSSPQQNTNRWKALHDRVKYHPNGLDLEFGQFYKQSQWMLLTRSHAELIVANNHIANQFHRMSAPDEHYYVNLLRQKIRSFDSEVVNYPITYVNWKDNSDGSHPLEFNSVNLDKVRNIDASQYFNQANIKSDQAVHLFMRKVPYNAIIK